MVCPQAHVFTLFSACTYQIPGTLTGLACAVLWSSLPQSQAADKWPLPLSPDPEVVYKSISRIPEHGCRQGQPQPRRL